MSMKKTTFYGLLASPVLFFYSYYLISNYIYGDQTSYRALYQALSDASFLEVASTAQQYIGASDILSFYLLWVGAILGIDKDIYIALANTLMLLLLYFLARWNAINYSMIALLMCNFYVVVLMTGAERLKFAFIFLFLAALAHRKKTRVFLAVSSVFTHLQSLILLASLVLNNHSEIIRHLLRGSLKKKAALSVVGAFILGVVLFYIQLDAIGEKFYVYSESGALAEVFQIVVFLMLGLFFIKNKFGFFIALLALMILAFFVGGNRINMIAVFVGVYLFWIEGRGNHPFLYIIMIYFAFKSVPFVINILNHGNGFYGI